MDVTITAEHAEACAVFFRRRPDSDVGLADWAKVVHSIGRQVEAARYVPEVGDVVTVTDPDGDIWSGETVFGVTDGWVFTDGGYGDPVASYGRGTAAIWDRSKVRFEKTA